MIKKVFEQCELEQLHLSAAIQPHGALIIADKGGRVIHVSANIETLIGLTPEAILDKALPKSFRALNYKQSTNSGVRVALEQAIEGYEHLDVIVTNGNDGNLIYELIPHLELTEAMPDHGAYTKFGSEDEIAKFQNELIDRIAALTKFSRVMLYQFKEDGDGEVVAEVRNSKVYGSYLGLRFPASDIPKIARNLYLKNPWRLIPDAQVEQVPIISVSGSKVPDLTVSDLRSVSEMHRIYLANMNVRASLSFPIKLGSSLSALIACHNERASLLPLAVMQECASQTHAYSLAVTAFYSQKRMQMLDSLKYRFDDVVLMLRRHGNIHSTWTELGPWLMREFQADGVVMCHKDMTFDCGECLNGEALKVVDDWFCNDMGELTWSSDSLLRQVPKFPLSATAGVLAIRASIGKNIGIRLYLCRTEYIHEVSWGGNPEKPIENHDGAIGIAPRQSFEKWIEKRLGYCRTWGNESKLLALKLRELLIPFH